MSSVQKNLIRQYAQAAAERIRDEAINQLTDLRIPLSGDDSGIENAWEEICVQVQSGEESFFWDAYVDAMRDAILSTLTRTPEQDSVALWLQTDEGWDWHWDLAWDEENLPRSERATLQPVPIPISTEEIARYIEREFLLPAAERFTNLNIECYLEDGNPAEAKARRLVECMPLDTIVTDLWDWDIRFEQESFDDIEDAAFCSDDELEHFAELLADDFERWADEYGMDYDQSSFESPEDFSKYVKQQCVQFMEEWQKNVKAEFAGNPTT